MTGNDSLFQILSLDGGGIKGLFSAAVLAKVEEDLGVNVAEHFDLITGTSTGGIIALGLGLGLRPREIVQFYVSEGPSIFRKKRRITSLCSLWRQKYPQEPLKTALQRCFGDKRLADSQKRLVIPSYNLDKDEVYLFKNPAPRSAHPRLEGAALEGRPRHLRCPDLLSVLPRNRPHPTDRRWHLGQ